MLFGFGLEVFLTIFFGDTKMIGECINDYTQFINLFKTNNLCIIQNKYLKNHRLNNIKCSRIFVYRPWLYIKFVKK